jgi:hypothetical protein
VLPSLAHLVSFKDTAEPFGNASVNCQLAAALHMRALASEDPAERGARMTQLRELRPGF